MAFEDTTVVNQESWPNYRQGGRWRRLPLWAKVLVLPLATGFTGMTLLLVCLRIAPLPDESLVNPTLIDSSEGQALSEWTLKGSHAENIPLPRVPKSVQQATLAVEDVKFYEHHAFNPGSLARAFFVDLKNRRVVEGGSTITQQLAKNLYLNQDRTVLRKLKEALYAMQLELHESKQAIFDQYLNAIYYGHGAYGIGAAARLYFNQPVEQLDLAQAALLAGIPKGPSLYSPIDHFDLAKQRQQVVLNRMVAAGFLTQAQADAAYQEPIHISKLHPQAVKAPYFTATAMGEVQRKFHLSQEDLYRGGITVTTTLDSVMQQAAERAIARTLPKNSSIQAALVALDPRTGAIKAMVGGRDFATSPYNRVFAMRQPGSTFKAVLYTAALQHGWTPAKQVNSELTTFVYDQTKQYTVHDYGDFYAHRPLTLREALARSDNVYAVTTNLEVGPEEVIRTARQLGISSPLSPYPSLALGVFPVSPLEMATAYATLANGGHRISPFSVQEVRASRQGEVMQTTPTSKEALSPQVAFIMSDLLTSVLKVHGTAYGVKDYLHGPASGKTGTTDSDEWMVGYTPNVVCAVWVGYDDNRPLTNAEAHLAAPIWAKFMGTAQQRDPAEWFKAPEGVVRRVIDPVTAKLATDTCSTTEADYFLAGTEPTDPCPLHPASKRQTLGKSGFFKWLSKWF
ncbi:PBP1A family penicillin-binding protein [Alicyclobacillus tolerans]|uniref:transglycosylase domain-containing protein n=1 Tax=Alicyclobacillus tolerans TaxID=90970 RepID=UPI001F02BE63|nr:PBP1A family penicillin-binding protein [Alicyclobacillus tolerans]MCF8565640.1 PBP1A family penicillin-binding protein [Alicyclobacillus tolerans]